MIGYDPDAVPILKKALSLAIQSGKPHQIMVAARAWRNVTCSRASSGKPTGSARKRWPLQKRFKGTLTAL